MEKQLVSFGNYLLKKCKVKGYSLDGEPVLERMVTDADLANWREENPTKPDHYLNSLPSKYKPGDKVKVCLMPHDEISFPGINAEILSVHFTNSKVKYDLEINFYGDYSTRIYNIDSVLILDRD